MAQQVEGTSNDGENEFEKILSNNGVSSQTIRKLVENGLDTMYVTYKFISFCIMITYVCYIYL